ncbi:hypothetical protein BpHYR1_025735 [Brachionus plicatilis]|uniref:RNA-directed DNA polymerase from mobile element jockey-like n=1 Tax=Brachionus plicatilis TaxID=10195 RepID=A0A3M7RLA7_BRAPC|nr:hypothetical protein BpHYR1_025735 [Brachionus plicatilis]
MTYKLECTSDIKRKESGQFFWNEIFNLNPINPIKKNSNSQLTDDIQNYLTGIVILEFKISLGFGWALLNKIDWDFSIKPRERRDRSKLFTWNKKFYTMFKYSKSLITKLNPCHCPHRLQRNGMNNEEIELHEKIKYQGVVLNSKINNVDFIEERLRKTLKSMFQLKTTGMNDPSLKIEIKSQLYKSYCRPIRTSGCEASKINQTLLRKIKSTESTIIKKSLGLSKKSRTTNLLHALNKVPTEETLKLRKLAFAKRLENNVFTRRLVNKLIKESEISRKELNKNSLIVEYNEFLDDQQRSIEEINENADNKEKN